MIKTRAKNSEINIESNSELKEVIYVSMGINSYICIMSKIPKNTEVECRIYKLLDPITKEIRYIGKTVKSLDKRLNDHIYDCKRATNHRTNWINSLLKKELIPIIEEIENVPWSKSQDREMYWIAYFKEKGYKLCNATIGGEGCLGRVLSDISKDKLSKSLSKRLIYCYDKQFNFLNTYYSSGDAARQLNLSDGPILRCARKERRCYNNYIFSYTELNESDKLIKPKSRIIKVIQYDLNGNLIKEFNSLKEAIKETGICNSVIFRYAENSVINQKNYKWQIERK